MKITSMSLIAMIISSSAWATRYENGQCVPAKENPGAIFCSSLPKEACEAKRYICEWRPSPRRPVIIR